MLWDRLKRFLKLPPELAGLSWEELNRVSQEVNKRLLRDWRWWASLPILALPIGIAYYALSIPALRGFLASHDTLINVFVVLCGAIGIQLRQWVEAPLRKHYLRAVLA